MVPFAVWIQIANIGTSEGKGRSDDSINIIKNIVV